MENYEDFIKMNELKEIQVGSTYEFKDGRKVKVVQKLDKRQRVEVTVDDGKDVNPFWVNYSDLK